MKPCALPILVILNLNFIFEYKSILYESGFQNFNPSISLLVLLEVLLSEPWLTPSVEVEAFCLNCGNRGHCSHRSWLHLTHVLVSVKTVLHM